MKRDNFRVALCRRLPHLSALLHPLHFMHCGHPGSDSTELYGVPYTGDSPTRWDAQS